MQDAGRSPTAVHLQRTAVISRVICGTRTSGISEGCWCNAGGPFPSFTFSFPFYLERPHAANSLHKSDNKANQWQTSLAEESSSLLSRHSIIQTKAPKTAAWHYDYKLLYMSGDTNKYLRCLLPFHLQANPKLCAAQIVRLGSDFSLFRSRVSRSLFSCHNWFNRQQEEDELRSLVYMEAPSQFNVSSRELNSKVEPIF